jgi:FAD reductase [NAD(P)H]
MTKSLTDIAYERAKVKADTTYVDLRTAKLEPFRGFGAGYNDETERIIAAMVSADAFIIGSPVYDGMLSSGVKTLFEHIDYKVLGGKVAGFIIKGGTEKSFIAVQGQLQLLMSYFRVTSNPKAVFASDATFEGGMEGTRKRIEALVDSTLDMVRGSH